MQMVSTETIFKCLKWITALFYLAFMKATLLCCFFQFVSKWYLHCMLHYIVHCITLLLYYCITVLNKVRILHYIVHCNTVCIIYLAAFKSYI